MLITNLTNPGEIPVPGDRVLFTYDSGTMEENTWPEPPAAKTPRYLITDDEFKARLTLTEKNWLARRSQEATTPGPQLKAFIEAMNLLGALDVQDTDVVSGFQWLVDNTALTSARRDELLAPVME